jgi:hypothetical protein
VANAIPQGIQRITHGPPRQTGGPYFWAKYPKTGAIQQDKILEPVGLSMRRLQIRLFSPYFSSFSAHNYSYEPSTIWPVSPDYHAAKAFFILWSVLY